MKNLLIALIILLVFGVDFVLASFLVYKRMMIKQEELCTNNEKNFSLYMMMNQWVKVKQNGHNVADYLQKMNYHEIAIYGMGYVGETLVEELKDSGIVVKYAIDRNAESIYVNFDIVNMDNELESVDAIIITPVFYAREISEKLRNKLECPMIRLDDILFEIDFMK